MSFMKSHILFLVMISSAVVDGATLAGSFTAGDNPAAAGTTGNLTALGGLDWRIWDDFDDSNDINDQPNSGDRSGQWLTQSTTLYNQKLGGSSISALTANLTTPRDSYFSTSHNLAYNDGDPTSQAGTAAETYNSGLTVNGNFAELNNTSLVFTVTAASTLEHTLTIYGASRRSDAMITLGLAGATPDSDNFDTGSDTSTTFSWIYTATFTPDSAGDVLTVTLARGTDSADSASAFNNYRLSGAALSVIPEPSSFFLLLGGAIPALLLRRRV